MLPRAKHSGADLHGMTKREPNNLQELLEQRIVRAPDKPFLFSEADGRKFTYSEFDAAVNRTAGLLAANGVTKGDVVSLLMPNSAEYIIAYFASSFEDCDHVR